MRTFYHDRVARLARVFSAFGTLSNRQFSNLFAMQSLVSLLCADEVRRLAIAEALARLGLTLTASIEHATLHLVDDLDGLTVHSNDEIMIRISSWTSPDDTAALAALCFELAVLRDQTVQYRR